MSVEVLKKEFIPKYLVEGEDRFYRSLLILSLNKLVLLNKGSYKGSLPNVELLDWHDQSIILYRREGEEVYLQIAKIFRRAGHRIYRIMLKKNMCEYNNKFLNSV